MNKIVPMQSLFNSAVEIVIAGPEYHAMVYDLNFIKELLKNNGFEKEVMEYFIKCAEGKSPDKLLKYNQLEKIQKNARFILYAMVLRKYLRLSLREFHVMLAASPLYQEFCTLNKWTEVQIPSYQQIGLLENSLDPEFIRKLFNLLGNNVIFNKNKTKEIGFKQEFTLNNLYSDSTCIKANIHYPVDYVLFRDMIRTAMLKVEKMRKEGLKVRMPCEPSEFLSGINALCIEMTMSYRQKDSKKKRKATFRRMKRYLKVALGHVKSHLDKFKLEWQNFGFSLLQATLIINALEDILSKHKEVVKIAHTRIINEKIVLSGDKILSIYEDDVHVITRNKDGVKVEFGNTLQIVEQSEGFIVDYDLLKDVSPGDAECGIQSLKKIVACYGGTTINSIVADRGYDAAKFKKWLEDYNASHKTNIRYDVLPKKIDELREKMSDDSYKKKHKRRALSEAKIAHIKDIAGNPMKQKTISNRQKHLGIAVFTHNLKKLAKMHRDENWEQAVS